ncbi:MAG: GxxExxY protein [Sphingomonas sp.]|uniref:GxxExxY protein n=1 Tax=Sphingomonas sp. TaxID=28214 RepID=UPI001B0075A5|nr:GxxExxY protein [Sphingomonas sp.]MBO9623302.1 GxxExxY protein [Sphingomonas sp.]
MDLLEATASDVVDAALMLHREIGPGLLESVYESLLAAELTRRGHSALRQQPIDFEFNGSRFEGAFRVDLLVNARLVVEIKSVERLSGVHSKQLLTYLRLMKQPLGLLINFGGETLKEGLKRVANNYVPFAP